MTATNAGLVRYTGPSSGSTAWVNATRGTRAPLDDAELATLAKMVRAGDSNNTIALALGCSSKTVSRHRADIESEAE